MIITILLVIIFIALGLGIYQCMSLYKDYCEMEQRYSRICERYHYALKTLKEVAEQRDELERERRDSLC